MGSYSIKDVNLVNMIDKATKDLQELKGRQFVGRRVLATKISAANGRVQAEIYNGLSGFDAAGNPTFSPQGRAIYRRVTFTALTQTNPYGRLTMKFFNPDGTQIVNKGFGGDYPKVFYFNIIVGYIGDSKLTWNVDIRGPLSPGFSAEFTVAATDEGTVESAPTSSQG